MESIAAWCVVVKMKGTLGLMSELRTVARLAGASVVLYEGRELIEDSHDGPEVAARLRRGYSFDRVEVPVCGFDFASNDLDPIELFLFISDVYFLRVEELLDVCD